jgi:predicted transcriptional regulator
MSKDLNVLTPFFSHLDKTHGHNMYSSEWKPMTEKKKSRRIHASLVNRQPLTKVTFETKQERNRYVVEKRQEGHTLQTIADSLGLTREMIRQIIAANEGPTASTVRRNREAKKRLEAASVLKKLGTVDVGKIADFIGENPARARELLGKQAKKLPAGRRNFEQIFSDQDLLEILQHAASQVAGPLSVAKYRKLKIQPTVAIYLTRFGTWNNACELAGVEHGVAMRKNYKRAHSEEDMLAYVASYLADPRTNGSAIGYEEWQRKVEGAPSLSLIRQRVGGWNYIKTRLVKGV